MLKETHELLSGFSSSNHYIRLLMVLTEKTNATPIEVSQVYHKLNAYSTDVSVTLGKALRNFLSKHKCVVNTGIKARPKYMLTTKGVTALHQYLMVIVKEDSANIDMLLVATGYVLRRSKGRVFTNTGGQSLPEIPPSQVKEALLRKRKQIEFEINTESISETSPLMLWLGGSIKRESVIKSIDVAIDLLNDVSLKCPYCNEGAVKVTGEKIYPHRKDLYFLKFWMCEPCDAYVRCHKGTDTPIGWLPHYFFSVAGADLRAMKDKAHKAFDPLWKEGYLTRSDAYTWLAEALNISTDDCHISMFDIPRCEEAVTLCEEKLRGLTKCLTF